MRKLFLGAMAFVLVTLLASPMHVAAQTSGQASLVTRLTDALNSYDEAAVGALLTNDAVLSYTSQAVNIGGASYEGRDVIVRTYLPAVQEADVHYVVTTVPRVSGNNVTWGWRETSPVLTSTKVNFLEYDMVGVIQDGKFQSINFSFTEDSIARLQAEAAAQEPAGMPRTGQGDANGYQWLVVLAILVALGGAAILHYGRRTS